MTERLLKRPKGKRKTQYPCEQCFLHRDRCICAFVPSLKTRTRLSLIIHAKELKRTTNTGRLAVRALINSELAIRGQKDSPLDLGQLIKPNYRPVLFFPSADSRELNAAFVAESTQPIQLIVPDGNWRQASKIPNRHPELRDLPRVMISAPNLERDHLRAETTDFGMATLQAIAHAFGMTEGIEIRDALLELYQLKLRRTLEGRGHNRQN